MFLVFHIWYMLVQHLTFFQKVWILQRLFFSGCFYSSCFSTKAIFEFTLKFKLVRYVSFLSIYQIIYLPCIPFHLSICLSFKSRMDSHNEDRQRDIEDLRTRMMKENEFLRGLANKSMGVYFDAYRSKVPILYYNK